MPVVRGQRYNAIMPKRRLPRGLVKMLEEDGYTYSGYLKLGGIRGLERRAAAKVVEETRREWLETLEKWSRESHADFSVYLRDDIAYLRRCLKIPNQQPIEERRVATLRRVRQWRAKQKARKLGR